MKHLFLFTMLFSSALTLVSADSTKNVNIKFETYGTSPLCQVNFSDISMRASMDSIKTTSVLSSGGNVDYTDCMVGKNALRSTDTAKMSIANVGRDGTVILVDGAAPGFAPGEKGTNLSIKVGLSADDCKTYLPEVLISKKTKENYRVCVTEMSATEDLINAPENANFEFTFPVNIAVV